MRSTSTTSICSNPNIGEILQLFDSETAMFNEQKP